MTIERFANLAETTLAADYTAADATISVSSASGFPTAGVFTVRLDNTAQTILRVTAVSGTTFTVTAEEFDGNASSGDAVILVASRLTAERWVQSPESGEQRGPTGSAGTDYVGPLHTLVALAQSSYSWVNQGSATVTEGSGIVFIQMPAAAGTNLRGRFKSKSAPYTVEAGIIPWFASASSLTSLQAAGIGFRESGTGKISAVFVSNFTFASANNPPSVAAAQYNTASSHNSTLFERNSSSLSHINWFQIEDNNTNLIFRASMDKVNWYQLISVGRTAFMAGGPDQVGFIATNQAGSTDMSASFIHWREF